jgi:hypothetical protein
LHCFRPPILSAHVIVVVVVVGREKKRDNSIKIKFMAGNLKIFPRSRVAEKSERMQKGQRTHTHKHVYIGDGIWGFL